MTTNYPIWISAATTTGFPQPPSSTRLEPDAELSRESSMIDHAAVWLGHRPWLAVATVAGLAVWVLGRVALGAWRHEHHADHAARVTIAPPPEVDPAVPRKPVGESGRHTDPSWLRRIIYGTPHVAWEYRWVGRQLTISLWVPGSVPVAAVEAAIRGAWPGAATSRQPATPPVPLDAKVAAGGQLLPAYRGLASIHD